MRSEQELVRQKRGLLYARVVEDVYREGNRSPTQKCATLTESKQKAGGTFPWQS